MLLYDYLQRALCGQQTAHLNNLDLAARSLAVLAWAGRLDATGQQYHATLEPIHTLASNSNMQARESSPYLESDHVHFQEIHGTSPLHDAMLRLTQMLYVTLESEQKREDAASSYQPKMEETMTSMDEIGLGVHLYWAMEFAAGGTRLENGEISQNSISVLPSLRGRFAGGNLPHGWTTSRSFVDPALTGASTTDLFGLS